MELIYLAIGLVVGGIAAWLYFKLKSVQNLDETVRSSVYVKDLQSAIVRKDTDLEQLRQEKLNLIEKVASDRAKTEELQVKLIEQDSQISKAREEFRKEFENLANRIFEDKSAKASQQNKEQLDLILGPLREKLSNFEQKVEKVYKEENDQRINLKAEVKMLAELNKQLSGDANNLALALKGDNKTQGNWGELILEKILERSGLNEGTEFKTQESTVNADGDRIRPDVVVMLPENKHLIIDSKVSLIAYNSMIAASTDEDRERFLKAHSESVRSHVRQLGDKNYSSAKSLNTPDFVMLFMPIEAAFAAAMQHDPELYSFAWDRKIVIVSPTTLLATLRTVSSIWMQERRVLNAEAIADEGGKLYDKFVAFIEDMNSIGTRMEGARKSFDAAMNKLSTGTGNLVNRAEKMKKLGARTGAGKQIDPKLVEGSEAE